MAKKKQLTQDELRLTIDSEGLIQLLQDDAFGRLSPPLTQNRLHAAKTLLDKALASLQAQQIDISGGITVEVLQVASHTPPPPRRMRGPGKKKKPAPKKKRVNKNTK